jgi:hypothetical protein
MAESDGLGPSCAATMRAVAFQRRKVGTIGQPRSNYMGNVSSIKGLGISVAHVSSQ